MFILVIAGCDMFNSPIKPFIDEATGMVVPQGHIFYDTLYYRNHAEGFVAISPGDPATIHIPLRNPRGHELYVSLEGDSSWDVELSADGGTVIVSSGGGLNSVYNLTLNVSTLGRPMPSYALPRLEARCRDTYLASFSITSPPAADFTLTPDFSSGHTDYSLHFPAVPPSGEVTLNAAVAGAFSTATLYLNGAQITLAAGTINETLQVSHGSIIQIRVTAQSGETRLYRITVNVSDLPPLSDSRDITGISITYPPTATYTTAGISTNNIIVNVTVPNNTDIPNVRMAITHTGVRVQHLPLGAQGTLVYGSPAEFTGAALGPSQTFRVYAENQDSQHFAISVDVTVVPPSDIPGAGTAGDPFRVSTVAHLQQVGTRPNGSINVFYRLVNDIPLTASWTPLGSDTNRFNGTFDGGGHSITGLNSSGTLDLGLFGAIGESGVVRNLRLSANITGTGTRVGGIAGTNRGLIENSSVGGTVSGSGEVGGIVGRNYGTVQNTFTEGNISAAAHIAGGIVGINALSPPPSPGIVRNSFSTAAVSGQAYVGGVVGNNLDGSRIENSVALNTGLTAAVEQNLGRIAGQFGGSLDMLPGNHARADLPENGGGFNGTAVPLATTQALSFWQTTMGWNFTTIWEWDAANTRPGLRPLP